MIRMQRFMILILLVWLNVACVSAATIEPDTAVSTESNAPATTAPLPEATKPLMIRVHNSSDRVFDSVSVSFPEQIVEYGVVGVDSSSEYQTISEAYRYAYVQVMVGGEAFVLQPTDYVGEALLSPGEYTYVLDIRGGELWLDLAEEDELPEIVVEEIVIERPTATAVSPTEALPTELLPTETPFTDLNGTSWDIIAYGAPDRPAAVLPDTQPTAEFLDGQVSGTTGCNQYFGSFAQSADALTTGAIASTRRACAEAVGQQEAEILAGWDTAVAYELNEDTLIVHHETGVLVLVAQTAVQPDTDGSTINEAPEAIIISSPGNGSRITSPVTISGESDYAFEGTLVIEIITLNREVVGDGFAMLDVPDIGLRGPILGEASFESPTEPTPARISVFMISPRDGHIEHLSSVIVTLLPEGETPEIITADPHAEAIAIHSPERLTTVSGGTVHITGYAAPTFEQNLIIEILNENGEIVGQGFTTIASNMGEWGSFVADISYIVATETHGSLCVQDISPADGGLVHRNCLPVTLAP